MYSSEEVQVEPDFKRALLPFLLCIAVGASCGSSPAGTATEPSPQSPPASAGRFDVSLAGAGVTLGGVLHRPAGDGARRPGIVVLHGWQPAGTNGAQVVDGDRIGIVGFSQGGQVALLAATRGTPVRAVVAYYPVTGVARWKVTTANPDIPG
jgi:cephalosporin-C deacetylase-like acetyl esterase